MTFLVFSSFLIISYPTEWNVEILQSIFNLSLILSFNSSTALFVKEITKISSGSIFFLSTKYFTFAATVVVLPAPAPAIINE